MKANIVIRRAQFCPQGIHDVGDGRWHGEKRARREDADHAAWRLFICAHSLIRDPAPLATLHLQHPLTLEFIQSATQRAAAHLQQVAQLALTWQMLMPVTCFDVFAQTAHRFRHQRLALRKLKGRGGG